MTTHPALQRVERLDDLLIRTAQELVRTPSINPGGDERAVAAYVSEWLDSHTGLAATVHSLSSKRPNLIVEVEGLTDGPTLMLSGHLDTKPAQDAGDWKHPPFDGVIDDGYLFGRGACDMKAGVAAILVATKALADNREWPGRLKLVLTADEEAGGHFGAEFLARSGALRVDAGMILEPSGATRPFEMVALASRGGCWLEARVHGKGGHSSLSDLLSLQNANHIAARTIQAMIEHLEFPGAPGHPYYPQGITRNFAVRVEGGVGYGVIPGQATILSDLRIPPGVHRHHIEEGLNRFSGRYGEPGVTFELRRFREGAGISPSEPIARATRAAASRVLERDVPFGGFPAGTDAVHFTGRAGVPCVSAVGPGLLVQAHARDERVALEEVRQASRIVVLAALNYLNGEL